MAYKIIASQCTGCSACEFECPNAAISMKGDTFIIDPTKCTECEGHYDHPQCDTVCPVPKTCVPAYRVLDNCYFPGNVRELENCIRRTATLAHSDRISDDDFACRHDECLSATLWKTAVSSPFPIVQPRPREAAAAMPQSPFAPPETAAAAPVKAALPQDNVKIGRQELIAALDATGWVQAKAARMLKLTPRQIGYALRKYGIEMKRL